VPLPSSVLAVLDAKGEALRNDGAQLTGTAPWHCISLDPAGTLRALAYFLTLLGIASLALRFAASERGRYILIGSVALVCGLCALVTGMHVLLDATSLYGVYTPLHAQPPVLGPILNANHLGCLMAFGASLGVSLVLHERRTPQLRVLWLLVALGCAATALASESRGAAIGLGLGCGVTLCCVLGQRVEKAGRTSQSRKSALLMDLPIVVAVVVGLALAVFATAGKVADQLENTSLAEVNHPLSKYEAWKDSITLVGETPWVGVGRGAVEPTLTRVHPASAFATFSHLENEYVSAIVEYGIPEALVLALCFGWCLRNALRRWRDGALVAGALGGLSAVMFQSSVDFGIEILGIAVPVTIVAATVLLVPLEQPASPTRMRAQRLLLIAALAAATLAVLSPFARSIEEDHDDLDDGQASISELQDVVTRHPLDYYGYARLANIALAAGDHRALDLLNHAMRLHPSHPGLHRLAARILVGNGRLQQAALEYRLAMQGTLLPKPVLDELLASLHDDDLCARAIPTDWDPRDEILSSLREAKRNGVATRWLERVVARDDADIRTIDQLYALAADQGDTAAARFAAKRRLELAHTYSSRLMLAKVDFASKDYATILTSLADVATWHTRTDEQSQAWLMLCDSETELGKFKDALECLRKLDGAALISLSQRSELTRRIQYVSDRREAELKEGELNAHPADPSLPLPPVVDPAAPHTAPSTPAIPNPLSTSPLGNQ